MNFNLKLKSFFLASIMAVAALPGSTATPLAKGNLCGGTAGGPTCTGQCQGNDSGCSSMLYDQVGGDTSFECFSYNGPCNIGYAGGAGDSWKKKDPSMCTGETFFLWDEPTTYEKDMNWAVNTWKSFVQKYDTQLRAFRNRGGIVTSPLGRGRADLIVKFLDQCAGFCTDPNSNGYIGAMAINYYAIDCNTVLSAKYNIGNMAPATARYPNLPVYVTNWAAMPPYGTPDSAGCQYGAMKAAKIMLDQGWKVFWFGTLDCQEGRCNDPKFPPKTKNNFLSDMGPNGITMGQEWKKICDAYPHSGPSPGPAPGPSPTPGPAGQCKSFCESDRSQHQVEGCTPGTEQCRHCSGNMNDSLAQNCGGCSYCHSAGTCKSFCADDRFSESGREARHCSGNMVPDCGGCSYCHTLLSSKPKVVKKAKNKKGKKEKKKESE